MRTSKRHALGVACLVLIAGTTAACGHDDEKANDEKPSASASVESSDEPSKDADGKGSGGKDPGDRGSGDKGSGDKDSGEPSDATSPADDPRVMEFCEAAIAAGRAEKRARDDFKGAQDAWAELYQVGAPDDIPDDAAEAFTWYHDIVTGAASVEEAAKEATVEGGTERLEPFASYVETTCAPYLTG